MMRTLLSRIRALFRRSHMDEDLDADIRAHLDLLEADYVKRGATPEAAHLAARRAFGGIEQMKEIHRDRQALPWVEDLQRDIRYALRTLSRNPVFTAVAALTLSLGIGANTALFSVVNDYLFRTLPVRQPGELVTFRWHGQNDLASLWAGYTHIADSDGHSGSAFTYASLAAFRDANRTLSDLVAFAPGSGLNVIVRGQAEFATGHYVSGNFYPSLGVAPILGRTIVPEDDAPSATPVVTITDRYWERRFDRDPTAIGSVVTINNVAFTIAGITPSSLGDLINRGSFDPPDFAIPFSMEPRVLGTESLLESPASWWVLVMGRLKAGVTAQQAEADFAPVFQRSAIEGWNRYLASLTPEQRSRPSIARKDTRAPRLEIVSAGQGVSDVPRAMMQQLGVLGAIFGVMLLIVCGNLATLLLSRTAAREQEIAVRMAIGASRVRVVRQLLTESVVLGAMGGGLGWPVALACRALMPTSFGSPTLVADATVIAFACGVSVLASMLLGVLPAWRAVRGKRPLVAPQNTTRTTASWAAGKPLMVAQVALSLVLVVMAVLFSRTLLNLQRVDVGFDPSRLATFVLEPARSGYTRERAMEFYAQLDERLRRVPGVRAVTIAGSGSGMLWGTDSAADVYLDGADAAANRDGSKWQFVDLNFFETVGIRVRRGRGFTPQDTAASTPVAVVTESFARAFFGNREPLGRHFAGQAKAPTARQIEIVGIVSDSKVHSLRQDAPPIYYRPLAQTGSPTRTVVVRTVGEPEALLPAIADAVRQLDSRLPIRDLMTQQQHLARYVRDERTFAIASSFFGSVSLAISLIGLFGLMSYAVARRTREIGVRMALGAAPARVLTTVMGETLLVVAMGVAIGVGAAAATGRFVASFMFGLAPTDPVSIAGSAFLMLSVAAFAGYLPARRASRVDPLVALRSE